MDGFLQHVVRGTNDATGQKGTPTDFLAFHAKGSPEFVDGHVRMGIHAQMKAIDNGFRKIAAVPELKDKPIIIGESDPDGCAACQGPQVEGALTWAFEFEDQPYFAGQRVLATNGIPLPVLNVFRMFAMMSGRRIPANSTAAVPLAKIIAEGVRGSPDVSALAALDSRKLTVMAWHYHDDDVPGPAADIDLEVMGLPIADGQARLTHYRIDENHSNAFAVWKTRMHSPPAPNEAQYAELLEASRLATVSDRPATVPLEHGAAKLRFTLPRQGVSLLVLEWD